MLALKLLRWHLELAKVGSVSHRSALRVDLDLHVLVLCDHFLFLLHVDVHFRFDLSLWLCLWSEPSDSNKSSLPIAKFPLFVLVTLAHWNDTLRSTSEHGNRDSIRVACR